ncbi:MAG TPA: serine hydrolase domain-containing protein, partial [Herpetosiphonaceae bacterium]
AGFDDLSLHDYGIEAPGISLRESLAETGESRVVRWRPGEAYLYSNVGPVAAAYAVERASGRPYAEYVRERIFEPLGMASATFALPPDVRASLATSYEADGITVLPATNPVDWPTGSISLAPRDLAPLIQLFLNRGSYRGQALLRPESIERMERPATALGARQGLAVGYGLGLEIMALDGRVFYGHSGAIDGFSSYLGYLPDAGLGYAVSISSANDEALVAMIGLIDSYLTRELPTPLAPPAAPIDPVRLEALAGYYELATPSSVSYTAVSQSVTGLQRVAYRDGALGVSGMLGTPKPLIPMGPALFRQETDPVATVAFAKDADGADRLQLKSRSLRRIPAWAAWSRIVGAVLVLLGTLSSVLFALVWVPRWRFGGLRGAPHLSVRAWPLLAALCFAAILVQLLTIPESSYGYIARYGQPTVWSIGLFGLTLLFAGCALAGAVQVVRSRRWAIRRGVWLHSAIVSALMLLTLGYLASFGVIGVMTWR